MKEVREKKDKDKSRLRFWEMAGSKMASITGLTGEEAAAAAAKEAQEVRPWGTPRASPTVQQQQQL